MSSLKISKQINKAKRTKENAKLLSGNCYRVSTKETLQMAAKLNKMLNHSYESEKRVLLHLIY